MKIGQMYSEIHTIEEYTESGDVMVGKTMAHLACVLLVYERIKAANAAADLAKLSELEAK